MAYKIYIDTILAPVPPSEINIKYKGRNSTVSLADGSIFTQMQAPDLTEISFDLRLPAKSGDPYAVYTKNKYDSTGNFHNCGWFIEKWRSLQQNKLPFRIYIIRKNDGISSMVSPLYNIVTLDSMTIKEQADNVGDLVVSMTFKEYVDTCTMQVVFHSNKKFEIKRMVSQVSYSGWYGLIYDTYTIKGNTYKQKTLLALAKKLNKNSYLSDSSGAKAAKVLYNYNLTKIQNACKTSYYAYIKSKYNLTSEAAVKKRYGQSAITALHKTYSYKGWKGTKKNTLTNLYLVKGLKLTIPINMLSE